MKKIVLTLAFLSIGIANAQNFTGVIDSYFNQNRVQWNLTTPDVSDLEIYNQHFSKSTNINHVYVNQRYQGIAVFNAISNFTISSNNEVKNAKVNFISQISQKINTTSPSLSPAQAIARAASQLGLNAPQGLELIENPSPHHYVYNKAGISQENINIKLVYQPNSQKTSLRLAWDLDILILDGSHWYSVRIDAQNGALLETHDWIATCNFGEGHITHHNRAAAKLASTSVLENNFMTKKSLVDGSQYRVFPLPVESPIHGADQLLEEPADPVTSPFGWHDTNGVEGAEFTTTRGNNVRARADLNGTNNGNETEGGTDLSFDFPFEFNQEPVGYVDASTTNLFYWNNIIHDIFARYGFDEASGNFQEINYTGEGAGNDSVNADAQDGEGINNANFGTPPDGSRPRMQMFLWTAQGPPSDVLTINNGPLAGTYSGIGAAFGEPLPSEPFTEDLALAMDDNSGNSSDPFDACDNITNPTDLDGKIAVIRRGGCEFGRKVFAVQFRGAIAAIVVNDEPGAPFAMGGGSVGANVNIPSLMVGQEDGEAIIAALENGETINVTVQNNGPFRIDGTLDSGIITHEYGHGISIRLTGGASNVGCLFNAEQMGEGWSDYFGLVLTMKEGDTPTQRRGVGTFVLGQPIDGNGIRPAPYSTDFGINNFTYGNTNSGLSQPHGIGFVWATMLWDLTWALIDEYGFDPDIYEGTGGNNLALQLVVDALKLQNCEPGFVDGRDAILEADELANGGANRCLIWNVFAKRGLGLSADQGSSNSRLDQTEAFDVPEECALSTQDRSLNNFMIYPNPTKGAINIVSRQDMGVGTITIFDINGRSVFTKETNLVGTVNIQAGNLKTGVYIIQIEGENYTQNSKLIIN